MKARLLIYSFLSLALALPICTSRALESSVASNNSGASNVKTVQTGVIRGQVHFDGLAPKPARIIMSDPSCSSVRSGAMAGDDFVLGANSKLANVVVFIAEGLGDERYTPPTTPVVMEQKGCMYKPHVVALQTNQKLEIVNSDKTLHNIHPAPLNNREWNKAQPGGSTMEESFAREEIAIPVKCNVHPWMKSYIAVFKHPFFSVTSQDGSFELPNLPPGEYTLEA